jgi:hypothetical protein
MNKTRKHQQARFLLIGSMVIYGLLVLAQTAWCGQVDSEKIDLILRDTAISKTDLFGSITQGVVDTQGVSDQRLLGVLATVQTRQLGAGVKDWNEKNPKWKPIYDHIRADLENDLPALPAAAADAYAEYRRCETGNCYAQDIASNLQPADVDAILTRRKGSAFRHSNSRSTPFIFQGSLRLRRLLWLSVPTTDRIPKP